MVDDPQDAAIVGSVVGLGRALGLRVVAEGVETPQVWQRLAELGCDVAQGFGLARPMPAAQFERWAREPSDRARLMVPRLHTSRAAWKPRRARAAWRRRAESAYEPPSRPVPLQRPRQTLLEVDRRPPAADALDLLDRHVLPRDLAGRRARRVVDGLQRTAHDAAERVDHLADAHRSPAAGVEGLAARAGASPASSASAIARYAATASST